MKLFVALVTLLYVSQHALGVQVEVYEGAESVRLPCQVTVSDSQDNTGLWSLERLLDPIVHLRVQRGDKLEDQNQDYISRTSLRTDSLMTGDLSLTLRKPTFRDSETYTCIYKEGGREKSRQEVHLKVKEPPPPAWKIVVSVLVPLLAGLLVGAAGGFTWFMKWDKGRVLQVEVGEWVQSVMLPFKWTDKWWVKMKTCRITADLPEDVRVEWTDEDNKKVHVYENGSDRPEKQDECYRGRTEMETGDFSLKLKQLRFRDTGFYTCRVYNKDGDFLRERTVILRVKDQQVEVEEGEESVLLPVKPTADLPEDVRVEWTDEDNRKVHVYQNGSVEQELIYRGRTEMKKDLMKTGDFSLKLKEPTVRDTGDYTCRVYKKDGDLLRETRVYLKVKGLQVEVKEGEESVLLSFKTTVDLPEDVRVEWTDRDDRKVHVYQNGSVEQDQVYRGQTEMKKDLMKTGDFSLILRHLRVTDTGFYTCRVHNKDGDLLRERRVNLKVKGKQQVKVEAWVESVLLSFKTTADLPEDVRVEWRNRDNRKVHEYQNGSVEQDQVYRGRTEMTKDLMKTGDFSLKLRHPRETDTGFYYCRVYNKDGVLLRETVVDLWVTDQQVEEESGAASVLLPFQTTSHLSEDVRVEWTDEDNMKVHVYQNGSVEQELIYRGRTEMKTGDFSLKLKEPTVRDSGRYYCRVYNKDGDLLRETRVELWVKDQQVEVESGAESVQLSFKTTADLSEDVRVEWRDEDNMKVHVYQNGSVEQELIFRGRTEMKKDLMKTGDFSLILKKPRVPDSGRFTCRVYNKDGDLLRETGVELKVKVQQVKVEEGEESIQLPFKTTADLPEDVRVEWTDKYDMKVHVYQNGSVEQDQVFRGRTEMKKDLKETGDFSLILRHPRETDTGFYYCRVYNKDGDLLRETVVDLKVTGKKKPSTPGREEVPLMGDEAV